MTEMLNDEGLLPVPDIKKTVHVYPAKIILQLLKPRLKVEEIPRGENITGCFHFTDSNTTGCFALQKSVLNLSFDQVPVWDFKLTTTETIWKEIITGARSPFGSYVGGAIQIDGSVLTLRRFMSYFEMK